MHKTNSTELEVGLVKQAWKVQMLPDSFQRWHVTIARSLLISKIQKSENYFIVTEKISISPQPHVGIVLTDTLKYNNTPNIHCIKKKYSGQPMYAHS